MVDPPEPVAVSVYTPAATPTRSTFDEVKPFGPTHEVAGASFTVTSIEPVAPWHTDPSTEARLADGALTWMAPECCPPAKIAMGTRSVEGRVSCPEEFEPQPTIERSLLSASVWALPAAIATTPESPAGGVLMPKAD